MLLDQYEQITLHEFLGLYNRGAIDNTPLDHAFIFQNFATRGKKKEASIRPGVGASVSVGHPVVRIFQANISTVTGANSILTCDGAGHIYQGAGTLLLTVTGMIDFAAINLFNHVYILPIGTGSSFLYFWDGTNAPRQALGNPPTSTFSATGGGPGNVTPGLHNLAVCFVTNSGFTTSPGPVISGTFTPVPFTATAGQSFINVSSIPIGPAGTTQRIFLMTKSTNPAQYFFVPSLDGGVLNDNVGTTAGINAPDTDLTIDASDLFNLRSQITSSSAGYGQSSLVWYHGHLVVLDGTINNTINISDAGLPENFDTVDGILTIDSQNDQFTTGFEYYGTLYIYGLQGGLHSTQDNLQNPSSWSVNLIDMSASPSPASLSNVNITKYAGPLSSIILGITREGLYGFNGGVIRPALSLKIQNIFDTFTHGAESASMLAIDVTTDTLYMLLPLNGSTTPNTLVVGDFSDGLSADLINWSTYAFSFTPQAIAMAKFNDGNDNDYWLRLGSSSDIKKLSTAFTNDQGTAITAIWQSGLFDYGVGTIDQFRFLRFRATGTGTLSLQLADQDGNNATNPPSFTLATAPSKDLQRHINFLAEKMSVKLTISTNNGQLILNRVECWGKQRYQMLPN